MNYEHVRPIGLRRVMLPVSQGLRRLAVPGRGRLVLLLLGLLFLRLGDLGTRLRGGWARALGTSGAPVGLGLFGTPAGWPSLPAREPRVSLPARLADRESAGRVGVALGWPGTGRPSPGPGTPWGRIACRCAGGLWSGCGSCRRISWARGAGRTVWIGPRSGRERWRREPASLLGPGRPGRLVPPGPRSAIFASCTARGAACGRIRRPGPCGLGLLPGAMLVQLPDLHRLLRDLAPTPLIQPLEPHGCLRVGRELRDRTGQHELARIIDVRDVFSVCCRPSRCEPSFGCSHC